MPEETNSTGTVTPGYTTESASHYEPLLHMRRSMTEYFPLYDNIGTARGLAKASGALTDHYMLDTFSRHVRRFPLHGQPLPLRRGVGAHCRPCGML